MREKIAFLLLFVPIFGFSQFVESFSDGNLSEIWQGTTEKFVVSDGWLQLSDSTASGSSNKAYLATPSVAIDDAEWQITGKVKMKFTSSNYIRFYLVANQPNFTENLNGYFVVVGDKQKCSLVRQNGDKREEIIAGTEGRINDSSGITNFIIKVLRNKKGHWQLYTKVGEESDFVLEGEADDKTFTEVCYSGIYINFSSSNKANFFFDEIWAKGEPYTPLVQNISRHDVVFSEIMADPDPPVELPNAEYSELYNRTDSALNLAGWKVAVGNKEATIAEGTIAPKDYILLCSDANRPLFAGNVAKIASFQALPNGGQLLVLNDADGNAVSWVEYSEKWFGDDNFKKNGGFSLERNDVDNLNCDEQNWEPTISAKGGTPNAKNSVAENWPDFLQPKIEGVEFVSPKKMRIHFNKELSVNSLTNVENFISNEISIAQAVPISPKNNGVELVFDREMGENETVKIVCNNLECISGFMLWGEVRAAVPQPIDTQDVVINEILFDAAEDGGNFVEIFNQSGKTLDLSQLYITRRRGEFLDTKIALTDKSLLLFPNDFLVLTPSPEAVCSHYECADTAKFLVNSLPTLPKEEGNVTLILTNGTVIDELNYTKKMHHALVQDPEGISLERINPKLPTNSPQSWHSASEESGFGTPGRQNSQFNALQNGENAKNFWVDNEVFSPDNDGNDDLLWIKYRLPKNGFTANVVIFTPSGQRVKRLYNNTLLETEGALQWNGCDSSDKICPVGIYVLAIEATHLDGLVVRQKIPCVLSTSK